MDPKENKEDQSKNFGKVIDTLHSKQKLPSLRTYQGDMAEFIKEKNESVISIAVKEKERKEEKQEIAEKLDPSLKSNKSKGQGLPIKFTIIFLSAVLVVGGVLAYLFVFQFIKNESPNNLVLKNEIIPYNNLVTLANVTDENLGSELTKLSATAGINVVKISGPDGILLTKSKDFFSFLKISLPGTLERALNDDYVVGVISEGEERSSFIIVTVNDFGRAFSAMLEWEQNMPKDLSFLGTEIDTVDTQVKPAFETVASTTASTTVATVAASTTKPAKTEVFNWKDLIIKNKDTRGLVNSKDRSRIAYTFLDKNTILITNNISAVAEISSIYASRSVAR